MDIKIMWVLDWEMGKDILCAVECIYETVKQKQFIQIRVKWS